MLGNREKASKYKEQIQDKPEDVAATLIMVSHLLTQVRNTQPGESSVSNWELVDSLHKDLARARKVAPTDARLVVAEVNLQLIQPEVNRPLVVTALAGLFGAPTDTANQALAVAQLQCGVSWQVQKAEETLRARRNLLGPNLSLSYKTPLKIVRGSGSYLFDDLGRGYLDCSFSKLRPF